MYKIIAKKSTCVSLVAISKFLYSTFQSTIVTKVFLIPVICSSPNDLIVVSNFINSALNSTIAKGVFFVSVEEAQKSRDSKTLVGSFRSWLVPCLGHICMKEKYAFS